MSHTAFTFLIVRRLEKGHLFPWLSLLKLTISIGLIQDLSPQLMHILTSHFGIYMNLWNDITDL
jgi:hypothetical protein